MSTDLSVQVRWFLAIGLTSIGCSGTLASADVSVFYGESSRAPWLAQSGGSPTTISFAGLAPGTQVTNQFTGQGVFFDQAGTAEYEPGYESDGWVQWNHHGSFASPIQTNDGLRATFDSPMHALAMDENTASAGFNLTLYQGNDVVWSGVFGGPGVDGYEWPWTFGGIVSDQAFDRVWVTSLPFEPSTPGGPNFVILDTLMFSTVPGPGAALLLLGLPLQGTRKRRR